jgi:steroid delta-isomerase-like uncharacterized protein
MTQLTEPQARQMFAIANTRNVDKVLEQYADDATFQTPAQDMPLKGKAAIGSFLTGSYAAFPDWTLDVQSVVISGNEALIVNSIRGTHDGPMTGIDGKPIAPTHKKFVQEQMTHVVMNDSGKVRSLRSYGNPQEIYRQLGISA